MYQSWRDLLFLHWKMDPAKIQSKMPPGLSVDCFEGEAYVGVVPFFMCGVRPRFLPCFPGVSNFLELNVRTYVHDADGVPGVWFFSLDANCAPAVWIARTFFNLPYRHAKMHAERSVAGVDYSSRCPAGNYEGRFCYQRNGGSELAQPGSLEFFLLERYYLYSYSESRKQLYRGQVSHRPYEFSEALVDEFDTEVMSMQGLAPSGMDDDEAPLYDHACMAEDVDVKILGLERV
ncbi:MAG: hypothetical protein ACI9MB_005064 [Verrucomicrobiales bacterium]|jgi:uncharacterized protein YqjF (DUF2071 family)